MNRIAANSILVTTGSIGGLSLLVFAGFLFFGPFVSIDMGFEGASLLLFDGLLCFGFFVLHSGMIRSSFRRRLGASVPELYHGAFYTVVSGTFLVAMVVSWQPSHQVFVSLQGGPRIVSRLVFVAAIVGFRWGVKSLGSFDAFGLKPIRAHIRGEEPVACPLTVRGAYRWVRHPLYFFALIMIWSFPDLTADRALFNLLWTGWIVVGTHLEERDLVQSFGEDYRDYQRRVPMLVPRRHPRWSAATRSRGDASPSSPDID